MNRTWHASKVTVDTIDNVWIVSFTGYTSSAEAQLILQRSIAVDEQDVALAMDTYHVTLDEQARSYCGGIERIYRQRNPSHE